MTQVVKRLRRYSHVYEWQHKSRGETVEISWLTIKKFTPRSRKHLSTSVNALVVFGILTDEPIIRFHATLDLTTAKAVVKEIERERKHIGQSLVDK